MTKSWIHVENNKTYLVRLTQDFTSSREVKINGQVVLDHTPFHNLASNYEFTYEGISFKLSISRGYFIISRTYDLYANGKSVPQNT